MEFVRLAENKFGVEKPLFPGSEFGHFVLIEGTPTEEDIDKAKQEVVEHLCATIRDIAKGRDDFFIIKNAPFEKGVTVAAKFILPTVNC